MKSDDVVRGIEFVQIFGDVLPIPAVAAKAKDQCPAAIRLVRWDVNAVESCPLGLHRKGLRAGRQWACPPNGMDRKNQMALEFEHKERDSKNREG